MGHLDHSILQSIDPKRCGLFQGNGLVTDAGIIASTGISDPNLFFQQMLTKPYVDQLIAIPHVYGPSVSLAQSGFSGARLYQMLSNSMGYLNKQGYCHNGICQKFPVVLGETGFDPSNSGDRAFISSLTNYINAFGDANDSLHEPLSGAILWCLNQNTDGNLQLLETDWATLDWTKINWMRTIGLTPWYAPNNDNSSAATFTTVSTESAGTSAATRPPITQSRGLQIRGLVWPGFDSNQTGVSGTVSGTGPVVDISDPDFATNVQAIFALGFDTIVLPFTFAGLRLPPAPANAQCLLSADQFKQALTPANITYALRSIPEIQYQVTGACNNYLPNTSAQDRFLFVVDYLAQNGFYVILQNLDSELATSQPDVWVTQLIYLLTDLSSQPGIIVSPLGAKSLDRLDFESESFRPGLSDLYLTALDAINSVAPNIAGYLLELPDAIGISPSFLQSLQSKAYSESVLFAQNVSNTLANTVTLNLNQDSFEQYINESYQNSSGWIWNTLVDVENAALLQNADLRPWFSPPSPNRTATYAQTISNAPLQIAPSLCQTSIRILAEGLSDQGDSVAVVEIVVMNTADTTVFPPWSFTVVNGNITGLSQSYGLTSVSVSSGMLSGRGSRFWQTLWPAASNNRTLQLVLNVAEIPTTFETMLNGNVCETDMF